jgi:hypothetical protein
MPFRSYIRFPVPDGPPPVEECPDLTCLDDVNGTTQWAGQSREDEMAACLAPACPASPAVTGCMWRYDADIPGEMEGEYERIREEVSRGVLTKYSADPAKGIIEGLARYAGTIDPVLYAALLKDLSEGYGIDLGNQVVGAMDSYRKAVKDDGEFIERAVKWLDALNLDRSLYAGMLTAVLYHVRKTALGDPSIAIPLFRQNAYDDQICEKLNEKKPELFEHLLKTSPAFFKNVKVFHPEWISEEVTIEAVRLDGSLYDALSDELKQRDDIIDAAVRTGKCPLNKIPRAKLTDERIIVSLTADPKSIVTLPYFSPLGQQFAPDGGRPKLRAYEEYCVIACKRNGMALGVIPEKFRTPAMISAALENDERVLVYVTRPHECARYKDAKDPFAAYNKDVLRLVRREPPLYNELSADNSARYDPEVMKAAIEDEKNARLILGNVNTRKEVVIAIVSKDGLMLQYVNDRFRNDFDVVEAAVRQNPEAIFFTDMEHVQRLRKYLLANERTKALFGELPHRRITSGRFASKTDEMMAEANRASAEAELKAHPGAPRHPDRPIALFLFPAADHSGAFNVNYIHRLDKLGYQVIYYEYANELEYANIIAAYLPLLRKDDVVAAGGHGTRTSMQAGKAAGRYYNEWEFVHVDLKDEKMLLNMLPEEEIPEGVHFIAQSCSNAAGGPEADNMMNMHYRVFRKKWHVYSPKEDNNMYVIGAYGDNITLKPLNSNVEYPTVYHRLPHDGGVVESVDHRRAGAAVYERDYKEAANEDIVPLFEAAESVGDAVKDVIKDGMSLLFGRLG